MGRGNSPHTKRKGIIMSKEDLSDIRRPLKQSIYRERSRWTKAGYQPLCAICGKPPHNGQALEMHESLITRGDVSGNIELMYDIMTRYNCVLVHRECHVPANSDENKLLCAVNILQYEDYRKVNKWLNCMNTRMLSNTARVAKSLLIEASRHPELQHRFSERITMECKICNEDVFTHSEKKAKDCLKSAGITVKGKEPIGLISELSVPVTINYKHNHIRYDGGEITSEDIDLDLLRLCLTSDKIEVPKEDFSTGGEKVDIYSESKEGEENYD